MTLNEIFVLLEFDRYIYLYLCKYIYIYRIDGIKFQQKFRDYSSEVDLGSLLSTYILWPSTAINLNNNRISDPLTLITVHRNQRDVIYWRKMCHLFCKKCYYNINVNILNLQMKYRKLTLCLIPRLLLATLLNLTSLLMEG